MSSQTDMPARDATNARLEASLEILKRNSASKIKELEAKVKELEQWNADLELDNAMSAQGSVFQSTQPGTSSGLSDPALRDQISELQNQLQAKDRIIAQQDDRLSDLVNTLTSSRHVIAGLGDRLSEAGENIASALSDEASYSKHQSPKELTGAGDHGRARPSESRVFSQEMALERFPTGPASGRAADPFSRMQVEKDGGAGRGGPPATPFKFPAYPAPAPAAPSPLSYVGALQTPRPTRPLRSRGTPRQSLQTFTRAGPLQTRPSRSRGTPRQSLHTVTHAGVDAKNAADEESAPGQVSQGQSLMANRGTSQAGLRVRGALRGASFSSASTTRRTPEVVKAEPLSPGLFDSGPRPAEASFTSIAQASPFGSSHVPTETATVGESPFGKLGRSSGLESHNAPSSRNVGTPLDPAHRSTAFDLASRSAPVQGSSEGSPADRVKNPLKEDLPADFCSRFGIKPLKQGGGDTSGGSFESRKRSADEEQPIPSDSKRLRST